MQVRTKKSLLGVTLLEVMLVLAIAAMIIVMSVRYYQSAATAQQTSGLLLQINNITSIGDSLAQGAGTYKVVSQSAVEALMPNKNMTAPWGSGISISKSAATTYVVTVSSTPAGVCNQILPKLKANDKYTGANCDNTKASSLVYTYNVGF